MYQSLSSVDVNGVGQEITIESRIYHVYKVIPGSKLRNGLVERLKDYAARRLVWLGLPIFHRCVVSTDDETGYYKVRFINEQKCGIAVSGIMLNKGGWPFLDHSIHIETETDCDG